MAKKLNIESRVEELLRQLTLTEKVSLLSGKNIWKTVPVERLGIPSIVMTDGPHGVRAANPDSGRKMGPTTAFPTGISMGACWDPALVERVGQALGEETRAMDCDILLGPCVNIIRHPLDGRNFETYSEDPYLAGRTAVAFINGVQSRGVGTSLKHFAANNYEIERFRASSNVDERTLREIYLPQFEMAVKESQPWTVMCSYNRINGVYADENAHLLKEILKDEWGFKGAVISDWGATHTPFESVANGLDLEMPGPAKYYTLLRDAVENWQIDEAAVDDAARRLLRLILLSGSMDGTTSKGSVNTQAHQTLARQLAEQAITLLKNEGAVLPIDKRVKSIAVIGPNAAEAVIGGGGSSHVTPPYRISPLKALQAKLGNQVRIEYERGCDNYDEPYEIPGGWLTPPGLKVEFFASADCSGTPLRIQEGVRPELWYHVNWTPDPVKPFSARWSGELVIPENGLYHFSLRHSGCMRIYLGTELVLDSRSRDSLVGHRFDTNRSVVKSLKARKYALRIEMSRFPTQEVMSYKLGLGRTFEPGRDPRLVHAVELAKRCDVALVFAGYPEAVESEGWDRLHMDLLGGQNKLIAAVASANPRTVVVLNAGAPVSMPWIDKVAAVLMAYYPGMENGNAVARLLLGEVTPSGKLPVTFPKRLQDSPAYLNNSYPGCREVNYGEGIFVGYRYFDKVDLEPLFPFGHGLSYTTFKYSSLVLPRKVKNGQPVQVSLTITNTGSRVGKEVVQLYVADPESSLPRPPKELKAYAKVELKPGESREVAFTLDQRSLALYDPYQKAWVAEPGEFQVLVGTSSRDIRVKGKFTLI